MGFRINRVYTRTGDRGDTALVGGVRVRKNDPRVAAYGDVDELNSCLGIVKAELCEKTANLASVIEQLQQELFDLGAELATPADITYEGQWKASERDCLRLEEWCDSFGADLEELTSFIIPGGSKLAASLHLARTVCRRAERTVVSFFDHAPKAERNPAVLTYLNRLSDFLFIAARWSLRQLDQEPPLWTPAGKRSVD
ncbi:MAG: cob(I)yrinic acid a,c-diamide adenosyltransferase [Bdellovibrionales bacterium]|nr:cob(I)yrinic acid a,c-diamide adenosyltransferase [Bdellovibrionales bacterium]